MHAQWPIRLRLIALGSLAVVVVASLVVGVFVVHSVAARPPHRPVSRILSPPPASWKVVSSPNVGDATTNNYLYGLAAVSSTDLWAVGCSSCDFLGRTGATLVEQWNGSAWNIVSSANPGTAANQLRGVAAVSASDVWAVGFQIVAGVGTDETLVEHYDGSSWQAVSDATPAGISKLNGVAALSTSDVWAVGMSEPVGSSNSTTFIEHYDGTKWTQSASRNPQSENGLNAVAALSASDVWAVGQSGNGSSNTPLVEHFDGSQWSIMSLSAPLASADGVFNGVVALSADDVWAVGSRYDRTTGYDYSLVAHWNGLSWTRVPSPNPSTYSGLYGIAAMSPTSIWAVGSDYGGGSTPPGPLTEYWNGCQWKVVSAAPANTFGNILRAVIVGPNLSVPWAVGDYQSGSTGAFEKTLAETFTGQAPLLHPGIASCPQTT